MKRIARALGIFKPAMESLRHGATVVPLLLYFILKLALILLYASSYTKPLSTYWALLVPNTNAEALTHYPGHLLLMPRILGRLDLILEIVLLVVVQAATVLLFAAVARRERVRVGTSMRAAGRRYLHLALAAAIASAVLFIMFEYAVPALAGSAGMPRGLEATAGTLIGLVIQAFFLFTLPFILFDGYAAFKAIGASFRFAGRHFPESFTIVLIPFILTMPTLLLSLNPGAIAFQLSPEFLIQAQIAGEFMEFIATYLLLGALTLYFLETRIREETR